MVVVVVEDEEEEEEEGSRFLPHFRPRRWCWYVHAGSICRRGWQCTFARHESELHPDSWQGGGGFVVGGASVIMQYKFQQSFVFFFVPPIKFIDLSVQQTQIPRAVLGWCCTRCCATTGAGVVDSAVPVEVPLLQFIDGR